VVQNSNNSPRSSIGATGGATGAVAFTNLTTVSLAANFNTSVVAAAAPGRQISNPQVVELLDDNPDAEERHLVAWIECDAAGLCSVEARLVDNAGNAEVGPFPARGTDCDSGGGCFTIQEGLTNANDLALAAGPGGSFAVAWRSEAENAQTLQAELALFAPDGPRVNPLTGEMGAAPVETVALNVAQITPRLAIDPDGGLLLSWNDFAANAGVIVTGAPRAAVLGAALRAP
jgi:hypothetical protein